MTVSAGIFLNVVFPKTLFIFIGESPVPGPFVVNISLVTIFPSGILIVETMLFASFLNIGSSDS